MADARTGVARTKIQSSTVNDRRVVMRRFLRRPAAVFGAAIIALFIICAVFAPVLAPYEPDEPDFSKARRGPSAEHWLGNDELGRDLFTRLIYGARVSGLIGMVAVAIGLLLGVPLGLFSGYYGGWIDSGVMRLVDVMLAFPSTLLAIGMVAILGPGLTNAILAVGIVAVPVYVRLVRASALAVKELDYISAARALGASDARVIWRHVLPQCLGPILVQSSLQVAAAILAAAGLGFLGLGAPPMCPSGARCSPRGERTSLALPTSTTFPGIAIVLVVMGFNLLGDALRDALDPRLS